jgi:hypothetical protein
MTLLLEDVHMGRTSAIPPWLHRTGIELLGWALIAVGLAALVLPGPGLLALAGGLVVLSLRYAWAKRLLVPIKAEALKIAEKECGRGRASWLAPWEGSRLLLQESCGAFGPRCRTGGHSVAVGGFQEAGS